MKKFLILLTCLFLTACSSNNTESNKQQDSEDMENKQNNETITIDFDVWYVEPSYEWDDIDINFCADSLSYTVNLIGRYNPYGYYKDDKFDNGGVIFTENDKYGFMNGEGAVSYGRYDSVSSSIFYFSMGDKKECVNTLCHIDNDYSVYKENDVTGYVGGGYAINKDGQVVYLGPDEDVIVGDNPYTEIFGNDDLYDEDYVVATDTYQEDGKEHNIAVYGDANKSKVLNFIDDDMAIISISDTALLTAHYNIKEGQQEYETSYEYYNYEFYTLDGEKLFETYEDAYNFFNGYAAIKKNGKWGYIDTEGNVVIDFVFDKATPLSDGKAWVIFEGRCGRINIQELIDSKTTITSELLNVSSYDSYDNDTKYLEVTADRIKKRSEASTSSEEVGRVKKGYLIAYTDTKESDGYTWYKIADGSWIADDNGEWIKIINQ